MKDFVLKLSNDDNVAVARKNLQKGDLGALSQIPFGHKMSTRIILEGEPIIKYGQIIGYAKYNINLGEHLHTHNGKDRDDLVKYFISLSNAGNFNQNIEYEYGGTVNEGGNNNLNVNNGEGEGAAETAGGNVAYM